MRHTHTSKQQRKQVSLIVSRTLINKPINEQLCSVIKWVCRKKITKQKKKNPTKLNFSFFLVLLWNWAICPALQIPPQNRFQIHSSTLYQKVGAFLFSCPMIFCPFLLLAQCCVLLNTVWAKPRSYSENMEKSRLFGMSTWSKWVRARFP